MDGLLALQLEDGGWSTSGFLTDWKGLARDDGQPLDTQTSDGYGTGLVIVIARELGVPADDIRLRRHPMDTRQPARRAACGLRDLLLTTLET